MKQSGQAGWHLLLIAFIAALPIEARAETEVKTVGKWSLEKSFDSFTNKTVCTMSFADDQNPPIAVDFMDDFMTIEGFGPFVNAEYKIDGGEVKTINYASFYGRQRAFAQRMNSLGAMILPRKLVIGAHNLAVRVNGMVVELNLDDLKTLLDSPLEGC